jgi:hypothetical protein
LTNWKKYGIIIIEKRKEPIVMKKIFYAALPYIIFALVAMLIFSFFSAITYGLCLLVCFIAGKATTSGLLFVAFAIGAFAAGVFIAEEG